MICVFILSDLQHNNQCKVKYKKKDEGNNEEEDNDVFAEEDGMENDSNGNDNENGRRFGRRKILLNTTITTATLAVLMVNTILAASLFPCWTAECGWIAQCSSWQNHSFHVGL